MTQARMDWKRMILDMDGHANSAPKGQDLICAAESMLTQALLQTLIDMEKERKTSISWTGSPEMGFLRIEAAPAEGHRDEVTAAFRVTVTGLRMLAKEYPRYIELTEGGQENGGNT